MDRDVSIPGHSGTFKVPEGATHVNGIRIPQQQSRPRPMAIAPSPRPVSPSSPTRPMAIAPKPGGIRHLAIPGRQGTFPVGPNTVAIDGYPVAKMIDPAGTPRPIAPAPKPQPPIQPVAPSQPVRPIMATMPGQAPMQVPGVTPSSPIVARSPTSGATPIAATMSVPQGPLAIAPGMQPQRPVQPQFPVVSPSIGDRSKVAPRPMVPVGSSPVVKQPSPVAIAPIAPAPVISGGSPGYAEPTWHGQKYGSGTVLRDHGAKSYAPILDASGGVIPQVNTNTRQSLGDHIGRYYGNVPGGLDAAMESASRARVANNEAGALNRNQWSQFPMENVTRREVPVNIQEGVNPGRTNGFSYMAPPLLSDRAVSVAQSPGEPFRQGTLEHELSHSTFGQAQSGPDMYPNAGSYIKTQDPALKARGMYLMQNPEIDVRLAEVKRWYAAKTGRLADSPEESQKAWDMWHAEGLPADNEQESPFGAYGPTYKGGVYNSLPDSVKKEMQRRMMELVSNDGNVGGMYS